MRRLLEIYQWGLEYGGLLKESINGGRCLMEAISLPRFRRMQEICVPSSTSHMYLFPVVFVCPAP